MILISITGPESSGKTTLARKLAETFDTLWVPEYARFYLEQKGTGYHQKDLDQIAVGQVALLESMKADAGEKPLIFLDTWMLELRIWSQSRFGNVSALIESLYREHPPDFYVLCSPDLTWEPDPLRENPHDREALFKQYSDEIGESCIPYEIIQGSGAEREQTAIQALNVFVERTLRG